MDQPLDREPFDAPAVLRGVVAAFLIGLAIAVAFAFLSAILTSTTGVTADALAHSTALALLGFVAGCVPMLTGGFLTAREARHSKLKHTLATGLVLLGLDVVCRLGYWSLGDIDACFGWLDIVHLLLTVPITVLGGYLHLATA